MENNVNELIQYMMLKHYIGVKLVRATPMTKGDYIEYSRLYVGPCSKLSGGDTAEERMREGYLVSYPQVDTGKVPYIAWCPKAEFEKANFLLENSTKISPADVDMMLGEVHSQKIGPKTALVHATMLNGFEDIQASSCVDPNNYDHDLGVQYATEKIKDRLWMCFGFVLQWARHGLTK